MAEQPSLILCDGNCIVCDFEANHYLRVAPGKIKLIDISDVAFQAQKYGLTRDAVQNYMHVFGPEGELYRGVDAFSHIWSRVPGWRYQVVREVIHLPIVYQLAQVAYALFARYRHLLPKKKRP